MADMTRERAVEVLLELVRRFDSTIPTPMNRRGESAMRIEHFVDLSHQAKQAITALTAQPAGEAVAWQYRVFRAPNGRVLPESERSEWREATWPLWAEQDAHPAWEFRPLYANPAPQQPADKGENEDTTHER